MNGMVRIVSTQNNTPERYHTTKCRHYPTNGRDISMHEAKDRDLSECRFCSGEYEPHADSDPMRYINALQEQ